MDKKKKEERYRRIYIQLDDLTRKSMDPVARMATICAVLHHKMDYFFWTGFYLLKNGELIVGPYQGPVACQVLEKDKGVCWATVKCRNPIIVPDVHQFPGHIACDARSKSEITLPVFDNNNKLLAVMDIDAAESDSFDEIDRKYLSEITRFVYRNN